MIVRFDPPIVGALVALEKDGKVVASAVTDENGVARLRAPAGVYNLWVAKEDYLAYKQSVALTGDTTVSVTLAKAVAALKGLCDRHGIAYE